MKKISIYTDGACSGNPGPGGYGVLLVHGNNIKEISGGFNKTTNNRMELLACIVGLEALKEKCNVNMYVDSKYVVDSINKGWAKKWRRNGWMRNKKDKAVNIDLWKRLLDIIEEHEVTFNWVKGHAGHAENERCDTLATTAAAKDNLPDDENYLNPPKNSLF